MSDKERIYDEEIAPLLLKAGQIAQEQGMPFASACWYEDGANGETSVNPGPPCAGWTLARAAIRANGNFDALVMAVLRNEPEDTQSAFVRAWRVFP